MDSTQIGGLVALLIFVVLPVVIGLLLIIYAKALARSRLRFLARNSSEQLEPSSAAIALYRFAGVVIMVAPIVIILIGVIASLNQRSW
jgi:hypothetical protein